LFIVQSVTVSEAPLENDDLRWYLLQTRVYETRIRSAFDLFRRNDIEPILIKGWAAARLYPDSHLRTYTDIDLGVASGDFDRARSILEDEEAKKLNIDLHSEFRHLDTLEWDVLFRNSQLVPLDGADVRILSAEDHLRVLCVHWLTDGGADRTRLWDIYYAVENRPAGFDWGKCLDSVSETRKKWIVCAIGLAHKYFGLKTDGLPFSSETDDLPVWLTRSVEKEWRLGVPLRPIHDSLRDWNSFLTQLKKRIPPNPVSATIYCEGEFDHRSRVPYQARSLFRRFMPSVRRISTVLRVDGKNYAREN
jgi:hypothetical protein